MSSIDPASVAQGCLSALTTYGSGPSGTSWSTRQGHVRWCLTDRSFLSLECQQVDADFFPINVDSGIAIDPPRACDPITADEVAAGRTVYINCPFNPSIFPDQGASRAALLILARSTSSSFPTQPCCNLVCPLLLRIPAPNHTSLTRIYIPETLASFASQVSQSRRLLIKPTTSRRTQTICHSPTPLRPCVSS